MPFFNIIKLIILGSSLLAAIGCACKSQDIPELTVIKPKDKYLNCANLKQELLLADFEVTANIARMEVFPTYSNNPSCIINTPLQIERAQNKAENRVNYLKALMKQKNCL